jgi:hypothetical protein
LQQIEQQVSNMARQSSTSCCVRLFFIVAIFLCLATGTSALSAAQNLRQQRLMSLEQQHNRKLMTTTDISE